jgi:asparaginyl-tRNA synthetase
MIEPEVAFAELDDVIELAEAMVYECIQAVLRDNEEDLLFLDRDIEMLRKISRPFGRITYSEAVDRLRSAEIRARLEAGMEEDRRTLQSWVDQLQEHESRVDSLTKAWQREKLLSEIQELRESIGDLEQDLENRPSHIELAQNFEWGKDLGGSDETILAREFDNPVFVTHYPAEAKAFYMKRCDADPRVVLNMDLLAPEGYGEIIGGSQREDRLDRLEAAIRAKALDPEDYDWYLDLRRFGSVPHGGFGLGIERTLSWICGLKHVRETIPFPRTMGRIYP